MTDLPPIAMEIWDAKYRLKDLANGVLDSTPYDTWARVAKAVASVEQPELRARHEEEFLHIMDEGLFSPAGRIIAGAGSGRNVTLQNCYVMGTIPDDMSGIFDALKEAALTMQQGGGVGMDFSTIRPKGAKVKGVGADASGPLSFMDVWDAMCRTIMSAGSRRGAMMATMRCDHPDILDFIRAKQDPARLRMFNMSVLVTDAFMEAVKADDGWKLKFGGETYQVMPAREIWQAIMENTYAHADPGVIFIDRMNQLNNLRAIETISATNPCGEEPLPPYGACLLGSIVLPKLVLAPFTPKASFMFEVLDAVVAAAVRFMDNVVDLSRYPLPAQEENAKSKRRIGLGVTGLADALLMLGLPYDTPEARHAAERIMRRITEGAYQASVELAKEKGSFPLFNADQYLEPGTFASTLNPSLQAAIRQHGVRNSHLLSIAPTGTISLFAGNVSSGIEPIFAASYERKVLQPDGTRVSVTVKDYAVARWQERLEPPALPPAYQDAQSLPPRAHLEMQACIQKWVDTSISKTINLPESISFEDFQQVYLDAYNLGCKGCTTYRPNAVTGSVLSVEPSAPPPQDAKRHETPEKMPEAPYGGELLPRPRVLDSRSYKIKLGDQAAVYVNISDVEGEGWRRPFEIFFNTKDVAASTWLMTLGRTLSAIFRRPFDCSFVIEELRAIHDPVGGGWINGKRVPSLQAAIGDVIAEHLAWIEALLDGRADESIHVLFEPTPSGLKIHKWDMITPKVSFPQVPPGGDVRAAPFCAKCFSYNVKKESGCFTCLDCNHSTCG